MPKRRRYARKKFNRKRRGPRYTTWGSAKHLAKRAIAGFNFVRRYLNTEQKFWDYAPNPITPGTTGNTQCVSLIPLGFGPAERDGRQCRLTAFHMKTVMTLNTAANNDTVRMLLVQARTDVIPTFADILAATNTISFRQINEVRDYRVIVDKIFNMDAAKNSQIQWSLDRKMMSKLQFNTNDTAGTATAEWGHLFVMFVARENTDLTTITYWVRLRYVDN